MVVALDAAPNGAGREGPRTPTRVITSYSIHYTKLYDDALIGFTAALIAARRRHPALHADRDLDGAPVDDSGIPDVEWRRPDGALMNGDDWMRGDHRMLIAVMYAPAANGAPADRVAIAINGGSEAIDVQWPEPRSGHAWKIVVDSTLPGGAPTDTARVGESHAVGARSVLVV